MACTQCIRVFSTATDSVRFMVSQPEPDYPVKEDHLDLRPVVPNMPLQWDANAPDGGPARPQPPLPFQHDRRVVTNSVRKLYDGC